MAEAFDIDGFRGYIAEEVARAFGLLHDRAPALRRAIENGVRFIKIDASARELVFDTRALCLGLVLAGDRDEGAIRYGNSAVWAFDWLSERLGKDAVSILREQPPTPDAALNAARTGEFRVVLSVSVTDLVRVATSIAQQMMGSPDFETRHVFGAMLVKGTITDQVNQIFRSTMSAADLEALKFFFIDRIMQAPAPGETAAAWRRVLVLPGARSDGIMPFSTDTIALAGDPLQTARDARALARLICLREAAPLAIGIFGAWGSGKSTFMQQVEGEIRTILRPRRQRGGDEDGPFVQKVVHIRFNAWQFVDANLWASLTAEFFDQLRAGGWDRAPGARYAGLVERVNLHVHSLTKDAEARHIAAGEGGAKVLEAQKERDAATSDAGAALRKTLGQAAIDLLADLYEENKDDLAVLGRRAGKVDTERAVSTIVEVARGSNSIGGQIASIAGVLSKSPLRMATTIGALVLLAASALVIWHDGARIDLARLITSGFVTLASISTLALAVAPALRVVGKITRRGAEIAGKIDDADKEAAKKLLAAEMTLREATAEAEALALAAQRADQALARYVAPDVNSNPPRLLRYVLEDDPDTRALDAEIGLMGRTRRLFEAIDKIARDERESRRKPPAPAGTGASAAHGDEAETGRAGVDVPDRIILYIDDLDRCTEAQVYAVLQAIHLLLAFDLFAVVVGVDVRWVENALLSGMAGGGRRQTNAERAAAKQRAVEYLEKIFQVAFWLDRLGSGGADGGTHGRLVRALAGNLAPTSAPAPAPTPADTGGASDAENAPPPETAAQDPAASPRAEGPDLQADDAVADAEDGDPGLLETIQLERVEVEFLASPAIAGFAAATPRGVKRMINVYRLVRTRIAEDGDLWPEGRPLYPLIALAAAVETGQSLDVANGLLSWLAALPADKQLSRTTVPGKSGLDYPEGWGGTDKELVLCDLLERIARLRDGDVQAKDLLSVVKLARRFSFQPPA